jgi:MFS family permease
MLYAAPSFAFLLLGRIVVGFGVAVSGIADVAYLHEIAPPKWRGSIVSVNEACISLGFLLAFAVATLLSGEGNTSGWRLMFGLSGILAMIQFYGMKSLPESPNWLYERGRIQEAEESWQRISSEQGFTHSQLRQTNDETMEIAATPIRGLSSYRSVDCGTTEIIGSTTPSSVINDASTSRRNSQSPTIRPSAPGIMGMIPQYLLQLGTLLKQFVAFVATTMTNHRPQAYIALFLAVTQQLCGQTNVLSYAPLIFASLEKDKDAEGYVGGTTLLIGVVKFLVTVLVIWKIEQVGRRILLIAGMSTIAIGLSLLLIAFSGLDMENIQEDELESKSSGFFLALPGVLLVVSGYSMSFGPLTWLLTSELFPTDIRGRALGASTIVTYAAAAFVTSTFLSTQERFGSSVVFGVYLLITCTGVLFAYAAIPETKGRSEEEIATDLSTMLWWRRRDTPTVQTTDPVTEMARTDSTSYLIV